jgi:hypothetical protein
MRQQVQILVPFSRFIFLGISSANDFFVSGITALGLRRPNCLVHQVMILTKQAKASPRMLRQVDGCDRPQTTLTRTASFRTNKKGCVENPPQSCHQNKGL